MNSVMLSYLVIQKSKASSITLTHVPLTIKASLILALFIFDATFPLLPKNGLIHTSNQGTIFLDTTQPTGSLNTVLSTPLTPLRWASLISSLKMAAGLTVLRSTTPTLTLNRNYMSYFNFLISRDSSVITTLMRTRYQSSIPSYYGVEWETNQCRMKRSSTRITPVVVPGEPT
jgi:hypothetical protein